MLDSTLDAEPDAPGDSSNDFPVSLDTLAIDGSKPEVGDSVEVKVGGKISSIDGDTAMVTPETINDKPVEKQAPPQDEMEQLSAASEGVPIGGGDKSEGY